MPTRADSWIPGPTLRVQYRRSSHATVDELWDAAQSVTLGDTALLGRLVRWRIPGLSAQLCFDEMFRTAPFLTLETGEHHLVCGLVGRIWTLRRDYPALESPEAFAAWRAPGTARVVFAQWAATTASGDTELCVEARVEAIGDARARSGWPRYGRSCAPSAHSWPARGSPPRFAGPSGADASAPTIGPAPRCVTTPQRSLNPWHAHV